MGMDWDPDVTGEVLAEWTRWGLARHSAFLRPEGVALAIAHAVAAPRGTHLSVVEVQPEAPLIARETRRREHRDDGDRAARAAAGVGRRGRERPPRTSCSRDPIAPHGAGAGRVRRRRRVHRRPSATSCCSTGADANEFYFRAPEEQLDQAEAYPFMTPIFGKGVVFDAPPERRREMLHNQALRDKFMRGHAATIAAEVEQMVAGWDDEGEIDLLEWFAELTIYTSSACLIGPRFRRELDGRFAQLYHDLEQGTDPDRLRRPLRRHRELPPPRRGPGRRWSSWCGGIMERRAAGPPPPDGEADLLDILMSIKEEDGSPRFSADTVTGMFISMMFAGHHTTSGTAAWTLIELLRHPDELAAVNAELDELYADGSEVSFQALREIPHLESALKEALRLHPPLILLLRVAMEDLTYGDYRIAAGKFVAASPAICNRIPEDFPDPDAFVPARYLEPREEDRANPWTWIPFGAGRHRCVGASLRHDAAEGDLLGAAAGLGVRGGPAARLLPQRPLQDGRAARAALPGALPPPRRGRRHEDRRRPRPVPGPRRLRGRGARGLLGVEEGRAHRAPSPSRPRAARPPSSWP